MNEKSPKSHVSAQYDEDLMALRSRVLEMGGLVEAQIRAAGEAYTSGDISEVDAIIDADADINALEKAIDGECAQVVAKRQPTASDLRLILGVTKIVTDLERVGDEAKKIAKGARHIHEQGNGALLRAADVRHVAEVAVGMLRQSLDCFARLDAVAAGEVVAADAEVDAEFKAILRQLVTYMMEDPRTISAAVDIVWIARAIERIGDHAKNIAEHVVLIAEGRDIRHLGKKNPLVTPGLRVGARA